jgi:hypothetical protein
VQVRPNQTGFSIFAEGRRIIFKIKKKEMEIRQELRGFIEYCDEIISNNPKDLIRLDLLIENTPLDPVWKRISDVLLEKIRTFKRRSGTAKITIDLDEEQEGILLDFLVKFVKEGDVRVSERISVFLSEFIPFVRNENALQRCYNEVICGIITNLERKITHRPTFTGGGDAMMIELDNATGWQRLEAFLRTYHAIIHGMILRIHSRGTSYSYLNDLLQNISSEDRETDSLFQTAVENMSTHTNRHFREMTFNFIYNIAQNVSLTSMLDSDQQHKHLLLFQKFLKLLPGGIADDWSQIRFASSRAFLSIAKSVSSLNIFITDPFFMEITGVLPALVSRICLNRFHPAKSVSAISQEIWKFVFGTDGIGRKLLIDYFQEVTDYYIKSSEDQNHMISEAACHAIGEIYRKLSPNEKLDHCHGMFLSALTRALKDPRWPVRDAALIPSAILLQLYAKSSNLSSPFYPLWSERLQDSIASVRENAAAAFAELLRSPVAEVQENAKAFCDKYIEDHLLIALRAKPVAVKTFLPMEMLQPKGTNSSIVNATSGKKKGWGCCIDCAELKKAADWELTHGALVLFREMLRVYSLSLFEKKMNMISWRNGQERQERDVLDAVTLLLNSTSAENYDKLCISIYQQVKVFFSLFVLFRVVLMSEFFLVDSDDTNDNFRDRRREKQRHSAN